MSSTCNAETMRKYPLLASVCFLISKAGEAKFCAALSDVNDPNVVCIVKAFTNHFYGISANPTADTDQLFCLLCGCPSSTQTFDCCKGQSPSFCSNCRTSLRRCPCCNICIQPTIQRPTDLSKIQFLIGKVNESSARTGMFLNNFSGMSSTIAFNGSSCKYKYVILYIYTI